MTHEKTPLTSKSRRVSSVQLVVVGLLAALVAVLALPAIGSFFSATARQEGASGDR